VSTTAPERFATIVAASATGASHLVRGGGNEDAFADRSVRGGIIAAVADGHSDPRCVRARRGAEIAVDAALVVLARGGPDPRRAMVDAWRVGVDSDRADRGEAMPRLAYGTTLLAARWDERTLTLVQAGDGDIVTVSGDGVASRPIRVAGHGEIRSGATASLADDDVLTVFALATVSPDEPRLVLLASDGLDNAYPTEGDLLDAAAEIVRRPELRERAALQREVDDWVRRAAAVSADDATAIVLLRSGARE
jgi:serine/threonine protein phosphatase PrpC